MVNAGYMTYGDVIPRACEVGEQYERLQLGFNVNECVWLWLLQTVSGPENWSEYYGLEGFANEKSDLVIAIQISSLIHTISHG